MTYVCSLCPRNCKAKRTDTQNKGGICRAPYMITAARAALHFWEEPCISGKEGSGTVFFSGCQLKCSFCQNFEISHNNFGKGITPERLSEIFKRLENEGANNINLVSATPYLPLIRESLSYYRPNIPIVFNSGGYEKTETLEAFKDIIDIYLLDFKYFTREKSEKYSSASDYPEIAKKAILKATELAGPPRFDDRGIMQSGVIIRHLILPSATNDAISILEWTKENCPQNLFSLMDQYTVIDGVKEKELLRRVTDREYNKVANKMIELGLEGYLQEKSSASKDFIPRFDLSGI